MWSLAFLVLAFPVALAGCVNLDSVGNGQVAPRDEPVQLDVRVPPLRPGTVATYSVLGTLTSPAQEAGLWWDDGVVMPSQVPIEVEARVGTWAQGFNAAGIPEGQLLPIELGQPGRPPAAGQFMSRDGGTIWTLEGSIRGDEGNETQHVAAYPMDGRPDLFLATLFGGVHVNQSHVETRFQASFGPFGFDEYASHGWVWNATAEGDGVRLELDMASYHSFPLTSASVTVDEVCAFPKQLEVTHRGGFEPLTAQRIDCQGGAGQPALARYLDPRNSAANDAVFEAKPGSLPAGWNSISHRGFGLGEAIRALRDHADFEDRCALCVLVEVQPGGGSFRSGLLMQRQLSDTWIFGFHAPDEAVTATVHRGRDTGEILVEMESQDQQPTELLKGAYGIDLAAVAPFIEHILGSQPYVISWRATDIDWRVEDSSQPHSLLAVRHVSENGFPSGVATIQWRAELGGNIGEVNYEFRRFVAHLP